MEKLFSLVLVLFALGCEVAPSQPAPTRYEWFVGYDNSTSTSHPRFSTYPEMVANSVFQFVQPEDELTILPVADHEIIHIKFGQRLTHLKRDVRLLHDQLRTIPQAVPQECSDLRLAVQHMQDRAQLDHQLGVTNAVYTFVFVTDGEYNCKVQKGKGEHAIVLPSTMWKLIFLGVNPNTEKTVRLMCTQAGLTDQTRIIVIPYDQWRGSAGALSKFLGRPANPDLHRVVASVNHASQSAGVIGVGRVKQP